MKFRPAFLALCLVPLLVLAAPDPELVKKAAAGDPEAELQLADELLESFFNIQDQAEAAKVQTEGLKYLRGAASRGYVDAQVRLASYMEEFMEPTDANKVEAASWMRKAADQGHTYAQQHFGFWAATGEGVPRDLATAVKYLRLAAAGGDAEARQYLISLFSTGKDMFDNPGAVDLKEALKWQEQESLAPDAPSYALLALARLYLLQPDVTPAQRAKAEKIIAEHLADGGSIDNEMRQLLGEEKAEELDPSDPMDNFYAKAKKGDAWAQLQFFNLVTDRLPHDFALMEEARGFLRQAAERGQVEAQFALAQDLGTGREAEDGFIEPDYVAAAAWYRKAAEQKHAKAMVEWALILIGGYTDGVPKDFPRGLALMREAALAGEAQAQLYLSDLYRNGEDQFETKVPVDLAEAAQWTRLLVKAGDETAYATYGEILAQLPKPDPAELAEALQLLEKLVAAGGNSSRPALEAVRVKLGLPPTAPPAATVAVAVAAAPAGPTPEEKAEAAKRALSVRTDLFARQFNAATTLAGRRRSFLQFEKWIRSHAASSLSETGDWVLREIQPLLQRRPGEVFLVLANVANTVINENTVKRVLSENLQNAYFQGRERAAAAYRADEKYRDEIRRQLPKANEGDGPAQLAVGMAYAKQSDVLETSSWANAIHWLEKAAEKRQPGAAERYRQLVTQSNARLKAATDAKDTQTLIEMLRQKSISLMSDAHVAAFQAGRLLLNGGRGDAEDIREAVGFLESAAAKGHIGAMMELGLQSLTHETQPLDEAKALSWFKRAADAGNPDAADWVQVLTQPDRDARGALAYQMGQKRIVSEGSRIDFRPADPWIRYAARMEHGDALDFTTMSMDDDEEIYRTLLKAAERGSVNAMSRLAEGLTMSDPDVSRKWRLKAAAAGGGREKTEAGLDLQRGIAGPIDLAEAKQCFLAAVEDGNFGAMYHLGEMWFDGKMDKGSDAQAVAWWTKAAENGHKPAQHLLALLYLRGQGGLPKDETAGRQWLVKAADSGYEPAKNELAQLDGASPAAPAADQRGKTTLDQDFEGAAAGDAESMRRLGERYEFGVGVEADDHVAYDWFRRAVALGNEKAKQGLIEVTPSTPPFQARLGRRYVIGNGVKKDLEHAVYWYEKAAAAGFKAAEVVADQLAEALQRERLLEQAKQTSEMKRLLDGAPAAKPDEPAASYGRADASLSLAFTLARTGQQKDATRLIQEAAKEADTASPANKYFLVRVYFRGEYGVQADQAKALQLLQASAEAGYAPAQIEWGQTLYQGAFGVTADQAKGQAWFVEAAALETNDPESLMAQANLFARGAPGVAPDHAKVLKLITRAADQGHAPAEFELGRSLISGVPGLPADPERGIAYLKKAANQKLLPAAYVLGEIYQKGMGVPIDLRQALTWFTAAGNLQDAPAKVNALKEKLGTEK